MRLAFFACLSLSLFACGDQTPMVLGDAGASVSADAAPGADGSARFQPGRDGSTPTGAVGCNKMDILFVIDNSGSMSQEQDNLVTNFPRFIEVLDSFRNGGLQYRLGVTTTAIGGDFEFLGLASSDAPGGLLSTPDMADPWLDRGTPNLADIFSDLATVGTTGSAIEQPLRAAKYALVDRVEDGTNAGFLRPDALLALVVLTDEDDSSEVEGGSGGGLLGSLFTSLAPVSDFIDAYDGVAMGRSRWAAAVIAGDQDPTCSSDFGEAQYAERLLQFVDMTGDQATFGSICSGDLSGELDTALGTFTAACQSFVPLY